MDSSPLEYTVKSTLALLEPPPELTLSEWANTYGFLSPETSAAPGKFLAFGYQNGILDSVTDPTVDQIVVMKSARVGYTKCIDHVIGYFIHQDPAPILVVQPVISDAQDYSRTEILPMLRDTPVLAAIAGHFGTRDNNQRILKRVFQNGASVSFIGASSPGGFRRITARIVCFDEIDGYPASGAGSEGDQVSLGTKRTESFWNRKIILGSTPKIKGISRIEKAFEQSDKRRYFVACPSCGHMQTLKFRNLRWDKTPEGKHLPETAHFICEDSGCIIEEYQKPAMIEAGEWRAEKPFTGHAGFHIWTAYSLFPQACWSNIVKDFLGAQKDPLLLKTFVNTTLGETWEEEGEKLDPGIFRERLENYSVESIPNAVCALTAGIDVQGDRLEIQIIGWGDQDECWVVDYRVLYGDPAQQQVWIDADKVLMGVFHTDVARELRIQAACVDSGGHHASQVIEFCRARRARRVYATKGLSGPLPVWPKRGLKSKYNLPLFGIGVDSAKEQIYGRLKIAKKGPGYWHFPSSGAVDDEYFKQLTVEQIVTEFRSGFPVRKWVKPANARNEALDTAVLALAAARSFQHDKMLAPPRIALPGVPVSKVADSPFPVASAPSVKSLAGLFASSKKKR